MTDDEPVRRKRILNPGAPPTLPPHERSWTTRTRPVVSIFRFRSAPDGCSADGRAEESVISNSRNLRPFLCTVSRGFVATVPSPTIST